MRNVTGIRTFSCFAGFFTFSVATALVGPTPHAQDAAEKRPDQQRRSEPYSEAHDVPEAALKARALRQDFPGPFDREIGESVSSDPQPNTLLDLVRRIVPPSTLIDLTPAPQLLVKGTKEDHKLIDAILQSFAAETPALVNLTAEFFDSPAPPLGWKAKSPWERTANSGPAETKDPEIEKLRSRVLKLIERLEAEAIDQRASASAELKSLGPRVLPLLKEAVKGATPEAEARLEEIASALLPEEELPIRAVRVPEEKVPQFVAHLLGDGRAKRGPAPTVTPFNCQRTYLMFATKMAYVHEYEGRFDKDGTLERIPVVAVATTGRFISARPILTSMNRKEILLHKLHIVLSEKKNPTVECRKVPTPLGVVEDPEVQSCRFVLSPILVENERLLIGPLPNPRGKKDGLRVWALISWSVQE
jgi:hypothetical protein